jgi:Matrixin
MTMTISAGLFLGGLSTAGWAKAPFTIMAAIQSLSIERPPMPADARSTSLSSPPSAIQGAGGYAFMAVQPQDPQAPVAWDPCRPIHVVVNSQGAPPDASRLLTAALADVSHATGLQFIVEGSTSEQPRSPRPPIDKKRYGDRWSPVLVAWTTPSVIPELDGDVAGLGGSVSFPGVTGQTPRWVSGVVYLDAPAIRDVLLQGPQGFDESRVILMHELGHLVGLAHVTQKGELMDATYHGGPPTFGPGDLRGLRLLGLGRCHTDT